ncbi:MULTISPECIES: cation diffusion facilitator family transporter [unclassified Veillonella]|uniref:cation diffusion facilitator family transporter n=1 Tax=unclassified Veillonella TaxID=2630086 RepID=UPI000795CC8E|nr:MULTISPECIES: cation diffusion facilitator family transporter [unclassified Veillonella]KXB88724.1 cation diffusion facilitator family transporter [Veillonella sp. DNF00869]
MTEVLIRLFVKNKDEVKDTNVRQQYGIMASITGIVVNVLVCLGELIIGFLIGSIAMISDAIHNVADAGGSLVSFLSFKLSGRKADAEHPYGHGRMEYLLSIGFSILLFVVAAQLGIEAVEHIMNPEVVEFSISALAVMLGAMALKIWLSFFLRSIGNRIDSPILRANGKEALSDVWATAAIAIGLLLGGIFQLSVDGYLGLIVALIIAKAGFEVLKEATDRLLGFEPTAERVQEIINFVESKAGILGTHDLMIHDYGPGHEYASIHVEVDAKQDAMTIHNMIDRVERQALKELQLKLTIHMDPIVVNEQTLALQQRLVAVIQAYDDSFSLYDIRIDMEHRKISFDVQVPHDVKYTKEELSQKLSLLVEAVLPTFLVKPNVVHGYTGV